jgi:hypothetical protein
MKTEQCFTDYLYSGTDELWTTEFPTARMRVYAEIKVFKCHWGGAFFWKNAWMKQRGDDMKRYWIRFGAFGALAGLLAGGAACAGEVGKQPAAPGSGMLISNIKCNGNLSVPMTADAEQSLPLHLVANLQCGQEVTVLSDMEGYTINIQTEDGKSGYVAGVYLTRPTLKAASAVVEAPVLTNGVARWQSGARGSVEFMSGDEAVESLTVNGITVQVSLQDTGWKMRANIAVLNAAKQPLYVIPRLMTLDEAAPLIKPLRMQDPARMAKAANHQILWTSASAGPSGGFQPQRASSASSSGNAYAFSYQLASNNAPENYLAQQQAAEQLVARNQAPLLDMVRAIDELSLRESTLKPSEKTAGSVWFERDSRSRQLVLRVPVGGVIFEFPFSINDEK